MTTKSFANKRDIAINLDKIGVQFITYSTKHSFLNLVNMQKDLGMREHAHILNDNEYKKNSLTIIQKQFRRTEGKNTLWSLAEQEQLWSLHQLMPH